MITRISSVIPPKGSDLIFDHPYNAEYALGRFGIGLGQSARRSSRSGVTVRWAHGDNGTMARRPAPPLGEPGLVRQDPFRILPHNLIRMSRVPR